VNDDNAFVALGYPQKTIFQNIDESKWNKTWAVYYHDMPSVFYLQYVRPFFGKKIFGFQQFYSDLAAGNLSSFVFLEPRSGDAFGENSRIPYIVTL